MTNPNPDPFGGGGSKNPSLTWKDVPVGTTYECVVTDWPTTVQARDFDSREPVFWDPARKGKKTTTPNDQPVMNAVVEVTIGGNPYTIFAIVRGESLFFAIQEAQNAAGAQIAPGGILRITLTDREVDPENPHRQPRKKFIATYTPPVNGGAFGGEAPAAAPAPAQQQPVATPASAATPPAQPAPAPQAAPPAQPAAAPAAQNTVTAAQFAALQAAGVDVSAFTIAG